MPGRAGSRAADGKSLAGPAWGGAARDRVPVSMVMILVNVAQLGALFGFGGGDEDSGPGFLEIILLALLGPLAAGLIQAAISRSREYAADASGAEVTGDPQALADALAKIERGAAARPLAPSGEAAPASALMIANPFSGRGMMRMFSTHPDTTERIARLRAMTARPVPELRDHQ